MAPTVPPRRDIGKEFTWNVESVFSSTEAWEREFETIGVEILELERFRGTLADGPTTLLNWFRVSDDLLSRVSRLSVFASMVHNVDTADSAAQAQNDRATSLEGRVSAAIAFAEPEILSLGMETLESWMQQEQALRVYAHYFDSLFHRQAHVRAADVEEVLGLVQDAFATASSTHRVLTDTDMTFEPARTAGGDTIDIAQGNLVALGSDRDREVRRTAFENYADAHLAIKNTAANCLTAGIKQDVFVARVRRYGSSLEAALAPNHIPLDVFHNLIETYRRNLPTWHRYWRVRREGLGYQKLHEYDIKAPLTDRPPRVSFDQALAMILEGMAPLGENYVSVLRRGVSEQRWVDIYPNQSKRSGAYSSGTQGTFPFILMSFEDNLYSMSTLAHELGHSMHSYFTWETQPFAYSDYSMFVAEVASNFNQALVRAHLLNTTDDPDFQIALIEEAMSNFHRYFFIMPTLARFELEIHERAERDEGLTADSMIALMADLMREGYGPEVDMDDDRTGITWAQFSGHLYANFYVFQYATGIAAAHTLAARVLSGEPEARDRYLSFLRAGGSLYPLDALKLAGVDMTSPEPVETTFGLMGDMVDRLEKLLAQRSTPATTH
ncbi:MAG: oligoendopeptidase F [Chloroflexota bacterium]